jgi:biofilm PGA synthesis N-glycosyltransferase PgaC
MVSPAETAAAVQGSWLYLGALVFFAFYPVLSSLVWVSTSLLYYWRWERHLLPRFYDIEVYPLVTVLVPAYGEERVIARTVEGILALDYPFKEIVVVDDASPDGTVAALAPYVERGQVRLVRKRVNEGKAMALNDALPLVNGEIVMIMDADAYPDPMMLRWIVPHFRSPRVAAVTGNPRVANRHSFLAKLQLIEFASIVSLLRRSQRVWGRILTMSGVVGAFRRSALIDVGLMSPEMVTEDIDMTWKLQRAHYDVRYEPRALVWMQVPSSLGGLFRQRIRWAEGLAQVLHRNRDLLLDRRHRRHWPVLIEAVLSITWAYVMVGLIALWIAFRAAGLPILGVSPIPTWWGMLIGTTCLLQLLAGVLLERRYDRTLSRYFYVAVFYPIIYWLLMAVVTVIATPMGLAVPPRRGTVSRWRTRREPAG